MKHIILLIVLCLPIVMFSQQEDLFKRVEEMPRFPGCEELEGDSEAKRKCSNDKLVNYIYTNLTYPKTAQKAGVEGTVVIQFVVDKSGEIRDAKIARDIGENCGTEALRVVNSMVNMDMKWRPGIENGVPVNVLYTMPVKYKLTDDKDTGGVDKTSGEK